ncbi:hypothetical protein SAMN05421743_105207 [Thalassobacillus cyri]|uniref:5-bromo-4-chloroindolyl phosphate hydrolysis protein n=1 Tax=Thalassobacillus cyri TaxID=571932 RepID=A0A1H4BZL2_9BACI|nr:hypothetical protein [Thalassobacillus cyri]SEA53510.1 hypothetical protein SAMN05421743_105207 [Thalassobacillus cyri]
MSDKNQKVILYAVLISIVIADFFIYFWLLSRLLKWETSMIAGVLSFLGAVLGGMITLGGVYLTITNEKKNRLRDSYPIKKRYADKVLKWANEGKTNTNSITSKLRGDFSAPTEIIQSIFSELEKQSDEILDYATKVNGKFYNDTKQIADEYYSISNSVEFIDSEDKLNKEYARMDVKRSANNIIKLTNELESNLKQITNDSLN